MVLDIKLFYFFNNLVDKFQIFDTLVVFFAAYLQYFFVASFFIFLYFSAYSKRKKLYILAVTTFSSIFARLGVTEIIRFFYHRPRPFITYQIHQLIPENGWSFPSGHSAFFFAIAMSVYFYNKKCGIGFFVGAILMNISRIIVGVHYPSDIIGGAIVGVLVSFIVFRITKKLSKK